MAHEYQSTRRVQFHETDMAGIVHFGVFFIWMEELEHAFLRSLEVDVFHADGDRVYTWPRVSATCDFFRPIRFGDEVSQHLRVRRMGRKSITYETTFSLDGKPCARGSVTAACCLRDHDRKLAAVEIPPFISGRIEQAPDSEPTEQP